MGCSASLEVLDAQVVDVKDPLFPTIEQHEQAEAAFELLSKGRSTAVLVTDHGRAVGVMTCLTSSTTPATRNASRYGASSWECHTCTIRPMQKTTVYPRGARSSGWPRPPIAVASPRRR